LAASSEQGIILAEQGIVFTEQGISTPKLQINGGLGFRYSQRRILGFKPAPRLEW